MKRPPGKRELYQEFDSLRARLAEAEETLRAIRSGEVDALVVTTAQGQQVFSLRGIEHPYRMLIEQMAGGTANLSSDGTILYCNRRLAALLATPQEQVIGSSFLDHVTEADRADLHRHLGAAVLGETHREINLLAGDGTRIIALASFGPMTIDGVRLLCLVVTDLRAQKQAEAEIHKLNTELEQRVRERTAQLEATNKNLDAFCYSVSHDLRAPLRAIDGFSTIVLNEFAPHLPEEAQQHLRMVHQNAQQMSQMIEALLGLSRAGRQALHIQTVPPSTMVQEIVADLRAHHPDRRVEFQIGDLPECRADAALLRQVFVNLLDNAFKYTRKRAVARIDVGCRHEAGRQVYFVRDNGAGFDMQYADRLFRVFQRLHSAKEYEGTGVGLALVQRIIHHHGGEIWAEAAVDQGATFSFTLGGSSLQD